MVGIIWRKFKFCVVSPPVIPGTYVKLCEHIIFAKFVYLNFLNIVALFVITVALPFCETLWCLTGKIDNNNLD